MRFISQLINDVSRVLQELLKYFNGTTILMAFVSSFPVEPVIFCLYLNEALLPGHYQDSKRDLKLFDLYSITINFLMFLDNYHHITLNYTLALFCVLFISLM